MNLKLFLIIFIPAKVKLVGNRTLHRHVYIRQKHATKFGQNDTQLYIAHNSNQAQHNYTELTFAIEI